ncbi:hypothetical protein [Streptomyces sp. NPDC088115]|uniref:hypothetical protein n=1 Tax=Streptomyces sp. NPDC088115 TaxID=3365824 RepID=UPI0037F3BDF5
MVRRGMRRVLEHQPDVEVVGEERFALLDGELTGGPDAKGWRVTGWLPVEGPPRARTTPGRGRAGS